MSFVGLVGRMLPAVTEPVDLPVQVGERRQQRRTGDLPSETISRSPSSNHHR